MEGDSAALDFFEDVGCLGSPDEGLGLLVVMSEVVVDGGGQFADTAKRPATNPLIGEVAKEALHHVQPGCGNRGRVGFEREPPERASNYMDRSASSPSNGKA